MSILNQITKGRVNKPLFACVYGAPSVGKTSFAAQAPSPVFICTEDGTNNLDISRLPLVDKYDQVTEYLNVLLNEKHDFKTVVIDSLDHMEPMLWRHVCLKKGWETLEDGAYGRGFAEANIVWNEFFALLKKVREKMNVILICHQQIKSLNDPKLPAPYDRYELKLHKGASALVKEHCDALLFATYDTSVTIDKQTKKAKAFGGDSRILLTEWRAAHDGKNRFGLPYQIELSFQAFDDAVKSSNPESIDALSSQILGYLPKVVDEDIRAKAKAQFEAAQAAKDAQKLVTIKNRLIQITQE